MAQGIRIGLIGAGMMGREHIRNLKLLLEVTVTALADPDESSVEVALQTLGRDVPVFADGAALLEAGLVDAVIVSSPNHTHRTALDPVFRAGVHVLCEKPLATTLADARWIVERAAASEAVFWTGLEYRFMPPAAEFIRRVHAGELGTLRMLSIREHRFPFLQKVGDWNRFSRNTGGTMVEKCCHFFDLMRLITRREAVRVYCSGAMDVNHLDERYGGAVPDIIDNSYTVVDFDGGVRAMLDLCMFADGARNQEEITAVGDRARLDCLIPDGDLVLSPRVPLRAPKIESRVHVETDAVALAAGHHHGATYHQLRGFLDACAGRGPVVVTALDGLRSVAIGAAAELSARERRVVDLAEIEGDLPEFLEKLHGTERRRFA